MKVKFRTSKQQRLDGELGLIIDEMGRAMWNADKEYVSRNIGILSLTLNMRAALNKFQDFCARNYGQKS
jgi:hypothetical protein